MFSKHTKMSKDDKINRSSYSKYSKLYMYIHVVHLLSHFALQVTDSKGHILYSKEDAKKGKFAFTTEEYDMFEVCFDNKMVAGKAVSCHS